MSRLALVINDDPNSFVDSTFALLVPVPQKDTVYMTCHNIPIDMAIVVKLAINSLKYMQ